jgi:hypothetical protein
MCQKSELNRIGWCHIELKTIIILYDKYNERV